MFLECAALLDFIGEARFIRNAPYGVPRILTNSSALKAETLTVPTEHVE